MRKTLVAVLVIAVLVGGGAFYGGMKYAQSKTPQKFTQGDFQNFQGAANMGGARNGLTGQGRNGSLTAGDIIAKDDKSITVKMRDGGSKIVFYSGTTEVGKFVNGAIGDLAIGKSVTVTGSANQDGSITAQSIQLRPNMPSPNPTSPQ